MKHIDIDHIQNRALLSACVNALYEPTEKEQRTSPSKHPVEVVAGYVSAPTLEEAFVGQGFELGYVQMNTLGKLLANCKTDRAHWAAPGDQQKAIDWLLADGNFIERRPRIAWFMSLHSALRDAGSHHPLIEALGAHLEAIGYHNLVLEGFDAAI
ncbi:hypothetical protein [Marinobacterium sediminicola]|uniref:Uncharacterized protein n=1 Tax=Marinobacterium sediminicola TaxID=518898 RepID=A0ABY1RXP0_9GAMM|nr:hypothetical protein [Marinobacterium sediminicola]ULG68554.1 hypothetical protein LN244_12730 [Marinobacterium sediminicola]SMR73067.1 hypothetical protein SAMN04487964_1036 [Marinobacterium sediminicola]